MKLSLRDLYIRTATTVLRCACRRLRRRDLILPDHFSAVIPLSFYSNCRCLTGFFVVLVADRIVHAHDKLHTVYSDGDLRLRAALLVWGALCHSDVFVRDRRRTDLKGFLKDAGIVSDSGKYDGHCTFLSGDTYACSWHTIGYNNHNPNTKIWSDDAWENCLYWQTQDKKTLKRINQLIQDIERNGCMKGIGNIVYDI